MSIDGWFTEEEGLFYRSLVAPIKEGVVVEIGSWKGLSTSYIADECMKNHTQLYCVDEWKGSSDCYDETYRKTLAEEDVKQTFIENMDGYDINILHMDALFASKMFINESVDLAFLDASLDYEFVRDNIEAWYPKIKSDGILSGHDYGKNGLGVTKAVDEFSSTNDLELKVVNSVWLIGK